MRQQKKFDKQEASRLKAVIKEQTGYLVRSDNVLCQAFRRRSFCAENGGKSNEIFEFIGDHVLSYYVVKILAERCGSLNVEGDYSFRAMESEFTRIKQEMISNESFSKIIDSWGIADFLIVSKSDEKNQVQSQTKVKADLFEAIVGAIAIDSGWDPVVLETAVKRALRIDERLQKNVWDSTPVDIHMENAINVLKELAEGERCSVPEYRFSGPESLGYDESGAPIWSCSCAVINDVAGISRCVLASSKKEAKKAASYLVLCEHFGLNNRYGKDAFTPIWTYRNGILMPM